MQGTALHRALAVLVLAGALLVTSAGVASAENCSLADPEGDVSSMTLDDYEDGNAPTPSPDRRIGDVWRTSISHTSRNVVVRITMQQVPRGDWSAFAHIVTPRAQFFMVQSKVEDFRHFVLIKTSGRGGPVRCRAKSSRIIGSALVLTVARSCLGRPASVRVGAQVSVYDDATETVHMDDALRRGWSDMPRLSPRIRRG
ncbi:hypothetical protein CFH99_16220 [Nocardioides aromaticivorans]|uniref:Secreted protein n=1 Tax=Nocardioides aromaticivorans TaxID=200618 RepID=A0ABX7PMT3_9ACTN|nr:hypothetical protein [Nocardioides aromaticivorans]QSR27166.1 hypothetical protein CFH99_16220 [Nocardioides aromaticivorans]